MLKIIESIVTVMIYLLYCITLKSVAVCNPIVLCNPFLKIFVALCNPNPITICNPARSYFVISKPIALCNPPLSHCVILILCNAVHF